MGRGWNFGDLGYLIPGVGTAKAVYDSYTGNAPWSATGNGAGPVTNAPPRVMENPTPWHGAFSAARGAVNKSASAFNPAMNNGYQPFGGNFDPTGAAGTTSAGPGGAPPIEGMDFTQRGPMEDFALDNKGFANKPTASGQVFQGMAGLARNPPKSSNYAETVMREFNNSQPKDMSAYYNRAVQDATNNINDQMGARGMFGSTLGANLTDNAIAGIRAQQAKDEAQYGLDRFGMAGKLADITDSGSRDANRAQYDFWKTYGDVAGNQDKYDVAKYMAEADAQNAAQTQHRQRGQDMFGNTSDYGDAQSRLIAEIGAEGLSSDAETAKQQIEAKVAQLASAYNMDEEGRARLEEYAMSLFGAYLSGGRGKK